ncbi:uncharacterized protein LODBEIA_P04690 [Lodderomyces beijingensis]|uniref:non-specific serine/threonine protein kinase n=1 Tax=Lodderomyces beijingensis TaxID=1775926 RepID=A0ABP0ZGE8_9ASCO
MSISSPIHQFSQLNDIGDFLVPISSGKADSASANTSSKSDKKASLLEKFQENVNEDKDLDDLEITDELSFSKFSGLGNGGASRFFTKQDEESGVNRPLHLGSRHQREEKSSALKLKSAPPFMSNERGAKTSSFQSQNQKTFGFNDTQGNPRAAGAETDSNTNANANVNYPPALKLLEFLPSQSTPVQKRFSTTHVSLTPAQNHQQAPTFSSQEDTLKNYEIGEPIGTGAFASVYRATNIRTGEIVAIKRIRLEKDQDVSTLMGEIDLLKILRHPNIVKYHGFTKDAFTLNVILEYCSGGSLRHVYKKRKEGLAESQIKVYVRGILAGLCYLHGQGVVHRDVKAGNVLLTDKGEVKLADFGVAARVSAHYNTVVGTPNWMAPETILGGDGICTASDIWSMGATIIELLTTNPPYHDLNPMAALHAIGTDDHPPLPKNSSPALRDFLLECFQKSPNLRTSAKLLLKHQWLTNDENCVLPRDSLTGGIPPCAEQHLSVLECSTRKGLEHIYKTTTNRTTGATGTTGTTGNTARVVKSDGVRNPSQRTKLSKKDLLNKFQEADEFSEYASQDFDPEKAEMKISSLTGEDLGDKDPFFGIDVHDFDSNELEIQVKMEYLVVKLSRKTSQLDSHTERDITTLVKTTGRMLHLIKKYPFSHDTFVRDHGVLTLLELLGGFQEFPKQHQLWFQTISVLNFIFENNVGQLENFCFLGGIPAIAKFRASTDTRVRLQVARFIDCLNVSNRALSMFVSCGGLRLLSKLMEEEFDAAPQFALTVVVSIHTILAKDVSRSKSDLCRILAKYGVLLKFVTLLNRLVAIQSSRSSCEGDIKMDQARVLEAMDKIADVMGFFSQSEAQVRTSIASVEIFKMLFNVYDKLAFHQQMVVLKFIKSMSCISDVLKHLYKGDVLQFLARILENCVYPKLNYKEIMSVVSPIIYNCLSLNNAREAEFLDLGTLPFLKTLSQMDLPFRQFLLPIMCEIVYCDSRVRAKMKRFDILGVYYNLVLDPYWQSNALESLHHWSKVDPTYVNIDLSASADCLAAGFLLPKVANLESALDVYLELISRGKNLLKTMSQPGIVKNLLSKLRAHSQSPVVQLSLLKILKPIVNNYRGVTTVVDKMSVYKEVADALVSLESRKNSILIDEVAGDIVETIRVNGGW